MAGVAENMVIAEDSIGLQLCPCESDVVVETCSLGGDDKCGDGCNAFPQKPDSVISVKVEFGEGEGKVPLDDIAKRAEPYKLIIYFIKLKMRLKCHFLLRMKINNILFRSCIL